MLLRALAHRNYRLFFAGQLFSLIGTWMQNVAQSWLIYRLTDSALLLGLVSFATQIPVFLIAPIGGAVADRYDRHRIIISTQLVSMVLALSLATLTLSGRIEVWHIFLFASLLGIINGFDIPARQSFVVEMVGKEDLLNAIALNSSMFNAARIVGPAVAGVLVATVGEGYCFLLNGLSYIAVLSGLLMMRRETAPPREPDRMSPLRRIIEGFRFVAGTGPIRALLLLLAISSFTGLPYAVLMPIFADRILGAGARGLGILMSAAAVGAVTGSLFLARRENIRGLGRWVAAACAGFGVTLLLFSLSRSFWLSVVILVPVGFCVMIQMASSNTLIQAMVPDELRGRVMSVYAMVFMGGAPIGSVLAGWLAARIGAPPTIAIGAGVCLVAAGVFALRLPVHRIEARRLIVAQQFSGGDPTEETTGTTI